MPSRSRQTAAVIRAEAGRVSSTTSSSCSHTRPSGTAAPRVAHAATTSTNADQRSGRPAPDAPPDTAADELEAYPRLEVIYDGLVGLAWLQRPFYREELEMLEEHGWPPVLRKDFLTEVALTETDVLEIQETLVRR